ncbi:hypothetical protein UFOVP79_1 [uncultured Caudovirales phage]|uniref:Uncharacterized protein n=1 Tax=uncultured Caudovirales phage TaxID=2100421 RepID=A0A6J5L259_9CAUD|nr:hypothetical protein UFOVP79_1 [uncultured Caudovirales phage]
MGKCLVLSFGCPVLSVLFKIFTGDFAIPANLAKPLGVYGDATLWGFFGFATVTKFKLVDRGGLPEADGVKHV